MLQVAPLANQLLPLMDRSRHGPNPTYRALALLLAGGALLVLALLLPVNVGAIPRALLATAGGGTPSLADRAADLLEPRLVISTPVPLLLAIAVDWDLGMAEAIEKSSPVSEA